MKYLLTIFNLFLCFGLLAQTPYFGNNDLWGVKDDSGKLIVPCIYKKVASSGYSEGLLGVVKGSKWGFIDKTGKLVIPFKYSTISVVGFSEGLLACASQKTWGFIDTNGESIIDNKYDWACPFGDGVALVFKGKNVFFIDKSGNTVEELKIENLADGYMFRNGKCIVGVKEGALIKYGVIDRNGNWIIPARFDQFDIKFGDAPFEPDGIARVVINGQIKYLNQTGEIYETMELALKNTNSNLQREKPEKIIADNTSIKKDKRVPFTPNANQSTKHISDNSQTNQHKETAPTQYKTRTPQTTIPTVPKEKPTALPQYKNDNENTFAVIIANENYRRESEVEFALNDGQNFKEYCRLYLGLPQSNIHYVENATLNDMKAEINWITNVAEAYEGKAKLIFYYAGHGIPDEASRTAYLLPADGYGSDVSTGYKLDDLYSKLSSVPAEYAVAFLDACFSGGQRDGKMMASARGVAIKAKPAAPTGKLVVFSAAQGDETAYPYRDKQHGLFTYYLLEKIKETKGNVALGELADFLSGSVRKKSIVMNSKSQTPSVSASPEISNWNNLKLY